LKEVAESGYNVGYAAKRHFATYDCVDFHRDSGQPGPVIAQLH
jgi:hypothetical protein